MSEQSLEDVAKAAIVQCVNEYWGTHQRALTLASLGNRMRSKGFDLKSLLDGKKLASFIQANLSADLHVAPAPKDLGTLGVLPRSQKDNKEAFHEVVKSNSGKSIPRYHKAVWQAFTKPIPNGYSRIVNLTPVFSFSDAPELSPGESKAFEEYVITVNDIVHRQLSDDNKVFASRVSEKIISWYENHGLPITSSQFVRGQELGRIGTAGGGSTALDRMLDALSKEQLVRISLPLDVINSLRKG